MDLNESLMCFGLTRQESNIYLTLLSDGALTGYEAAKRTGISRSNAYTALACLVDKGAARLIEGTPVKYMPVEIKEFCDNKLKHLNRMKQFLIERLPDRSEDMEGYVTIRGMSIFLIKSVICLKMPVTGCIYPESERFWNLIQNCWSRWYGGTSKWL